MNNCKGHKRSRYNCCDDAGCTKINQCCKFEMKTNFKLAFKENLHGVSNKGLTLRSRVYDKVQSRRGTRLPSPTLLRLRMNLSGYCQLPFGLIRYRPSTVCR